jgi:uncharacterized YigZ family protein
VKAGSSRLTLAGPAQHRIEVKHSRFLAYAEPVDSVPVALAAIAAHSDSSATHNCWAYRVGADYRFNDDGEPGGTAGRPILMAIDGQGLDRVAVLVVRHFGGIKLGSGGLVRAYGGCAAECLRSVTKVPIIQFVMTSISCDFSLSSQVHDLLQRHGGAKSSESFESDGVTLTASLPEPSLEPFERDLASLSRGTIAFRIVED